MPKDDINEEYQNVAVSYRLFFVIFIFLKKFFYVE